MAHIYSTWPHFLFSMGPYRHILSTFIHVPTSVHCVRWHVSKDNNV